MFRLPLRHIRQANGSYSHFRFLPAHRPLCCPSMNQTVVEFVRGASTEISIHDEELLTRLADLLPAGTAVYVAHTPKTSLSEVIRVAIKAQARGSARRRISSPGV